MKRLRLEPAHKRRGDVLLWVVYRPRRTEEIGRLWHAYSFADGGRSQHTLAATSLGALRMMIKQRGHTKGPLPVGDNTGPAAHEVWE